MCLLAMGKKFRYHNVEPWDKDILRPNCLLTRWPLVLCTCMSEMWPQGQLKRFRMAYNRRSMSRAPYRPLWTIGPCRGVSEGFLANHWTKDIKTCLSVDQVGSVPSNGQAGCPAGRQGAHFPLTWTCPPYLVATCQAKPQDRV